MTREDIEKKVMVEYKAIKKWNKTNPLRCSQLMYDSANGSVWADFFLSESSWNVYRKKTIHSVNIRDLIRENTCDHILKDSEIVNLIVDHIVGNCTMALSN